MAHARCTDCDNRITHYDRAAMEAINADYRAHGATPLYDMDDEDSVDDLYCVDCLDRQAEAAQERRDSDYYGGDSPTLGETMEWARRLK
jgi:hypothetical protein